MKFNFDTILYILITLAILLISGLGSRRKKKLQQMNVPSPPGSGEDNYDRHEKDSGFSDSEEPAPARPPLTDQFESLEQLFTGQQPRVVSLEGESLESSIDEEELILEQIRKDREETEIGMPAKEIKEEPIETIKPEQKEFFELFKGTGEIKKAIIYSEILNRKYN